MPRNNLVGFETSLYEAAFSQIGPLVQLSQYSLLWLPEVSQAAVFPLEVGTTNQTYKNVYEILQGCGQSNPFGLIHESTQNLYWLP